MSQQNLTQKPQARNGYTPTKAFSEVHISQTDNRISQLSTQQALVLAARACNSILFGEPHPATFDRADLSQILEILTQMAAAIKAAGGEQ